MRPTPSELAEGIRALLRQIAPEITSTEGVRHYRRAMATLRDARWDDAGFDLLAENTALSRAIKVAAAGPGVSSLRAEVDAMLADCLVPASLAAANARNRVLRDLLCRVLGSAAMHDLQASAPMRRDVTKLLLNVRAR